MQKGGGLRNKLHGCGSRRGHLARHRAPTPTPGCRERRAQTKSAKAGSKLLCLQCALRQRLVHLAEEPGRLAGQRTWAPRFSASCIDPSGRAQDIEALLSRDVTERSKGKRRDVSLCQAHVEEPT